MNTRPMMRACSAVAVLLLAACGGGGGGGDTSQGGNTGPVVPTVAATDVQFTAVVVDSKGAAVSGATVSVATTDTSTGTLKTVSTTTDSNGAYTITTPTTTLANAPQVVLTISKQDYQTVTEIYSGVSGGTAYGGNNSAITATTITQPATVKIVISPLAAGQYAPTDGIGPIHLGDQVYNTGQTSANFGFQVPTSGLTKTINIGSLTGVDLTKYTGMSINISFRGQESADCADQMTFFQSADGTTQKSPQSLPLVPNTGAGYVDQTYAVDVSKLDVALGDMYLKIDSGGCTSASPGVPGDAADDFEFAKVSVQLNP